MHGQKNIKEYINEVHTASEILIPPRMGHDFDSGFCLKMKKPASYEDVDLRSLQSKEWFVLRGGSPNCYSKHRDYHDNEVLRELFETLLPDLEPWLVITCLTVRFMAVVFAIDPTRIAKKNLVSS